MVRLRIAGWVLLVLVVLAVAAACGGDDGDGEAAGGAAAEEVDTQQGGSIVVAAAQGVPQLDPYKILFAWEEVLYPVLWDALTGFEPGSTEIQPKLAESWEVSDDLKTYTFTLREGVTFTNGKPLTAEDVVRDLERALDPETAFIWAFLIPGIADAEAVDERTVEVTLTEPSAIFAEAAALIPMMDPDTVDDINQNPVGTGPFTLKEFVPDDHVTVVRNEDYWGDPPALDEIRIVKAQDQTSAVTSLRAGDIHVLWSIPWQDAKELEGGDVEIVTAEAPAANVIFETDNTAPPFDDVRARQALVYATDKQTIIDAAYAGKVEISKTNQPVPSSHPLFNSDLMEYEFDLDKAKELFAEAGVNEGDTLTFWTTAGQYQEWTVYGQIMQEDFAEIGINLEIKAEEINTWAEKFAPAGKSWPRLLVPNFYSGFPVPLTMGFWKPGICECNFDNAEYNSTLDEINRTADADQRAELYKEAQRIFNEQAPVVIIGQTSWPIGVRSEVAGVWEDPGTIIHVEDAALAAG
jgi:peptide/nickel transport system substrate-binding protein